MSADTVGRMLRRAGTASAEYENKVNDVRQRGAPLVAELRTAVEATPANAHYLRQRLLSLLGEIGSEPSDATLLSTFAERPLFTDEQTPMIGDDEADFHAEERRVTTWMAMLSLVRMIERGSKSALASAQSLLKSGDRHIAFALGMEMQERGLFSDEDRGVLKSRGINPEYKREEQMERLDASIDMTRAAQPPAL